MAKRQPFTLESNLDKVIDKVKEKPFKVMNAYGQSLVKEIRATTLKTQFHRRKSILSRTLGYWARKKEMDLQIGFKMSIPGIVGAMIMRKEEDPIKPVAVKNADNLKRLIAEALNEIQKE